MTRNKENNNSGLIIQNKNRFLCGASKWRFLSASFNNKHDFATVTLIPGRCFDRGGVSDFTTIEGRSQASVFFRSPLDQKEAIGVVFRSMDPLRRF